MEVTINQIIDLFKFCADGHYAIVSYGYGDRWELPFKGKGEERRNYPILWVSPLTHRIQGVQIHRRFRLIVGDVVRRGEGNEQEVESDTERWLTDIIAVIRNTHPLPISVELVTDNIEITPFTESSGDNLTGHYADITLKSDYKFNKCEAAGSWLVPPPPPLVCQPANYIVKNESGDILAQGTISSGSSKTITVPDGGDAIWELVDTDGNILATGFIPAAGSATITAPDSTIENSDGSYLVTVTSGGNLTLPDVDILVVDINDNPLDSATIPSVKNHTIDVVCVAGTVENSDQSYITTVASGGSLVLPDQVIEVNGVNEGSIPSVGTIEVDVTDGTTAINPDDVIITGRKIEIEVPKYEFDLNIVDRFGHALPQTKLSSNATWDLRTLTPFNFADIYLSRLVNVPTGAQLTAVYTFFTDIFNAGIFSKAKGGIWLIIGGTADDHSWNSRYAFDTKHASRMTYVGSPTHDSNGISTNGSSNGILTNASFIGFSPFDRQMSVYKRNVTTGGGSNAVAFGANAATTAGLFYEPNTNGTNSRFSGGGNATTITGGAAISDGLISINCFSATTSNFYRNGVNTHTASQSQEYHNFNTVGGTAATGVAITRHSPVDCSYIYVGEALTDTQEGDHYTIVQSLQTALGRNV